MKKLLIAMTAVAVGTCAWAAVDVANATLLDQNFNKPETGWNPANWTVADGGKVSAVAAPWSYSGENGAVGDGELTLENNALTLNTGSKVLTGAFAGDAVTIPATNVFFNADVTFQDPSDTLPALGSSNKFALVVFDNLDSIASKSGTSQATNLWVIAGYGTEGKRAYKLSVADEGDNAVDLNAVWLARNHTIVVKAYADAIKDASITRAGFLVMVDGYLCKVMSSCPVTEDGQIDYGNAVAGGSSYLGLEKAAIVDDLQERYADQYLIIANDFSGTLTSVDFQGQGKIDNVSLAATSNAEFGDDVTVKKLTFTYAEAGVSSIAYESVALANGVFTIPNGVESGSNLVFSVTLNNNYVLTSDNANVTIEGTAPNYTLTYVYQGKVAESVALKVFEPVAQIGGTFVSADDFINAIVSVQQGTLDVTLKGDVTCTATSGPIMINQGVIATIDLAGQTIASGTDDVPAIYNLGTLTIVDSSNPTAGKVNGKVTNSGTLVLEGGSYSKAHNTTDGNFAFAFAAVDTVHHGYWTIKVGSDYANSEGLVSGATQEQQEAVTEKLGAIDAELAKLDGATTGDAGVKAYIQAAYGDNPVPVATLLGAKNIGISVANNLPLMTSENAEFVAEAVAADDGNVAAFEFTLQDGSADKVLPLTVKAKLENIIKVCTDLNTWVNAKIEAEGVADADVKATVSNGKVKVQLKSKTGGKCFMKLKAE